MTARLPEVTRQPLRVILDTQIKYPSGRNDFATTRGDVLIITAPSEVSDGEWFQQSNVEVMACPTKDGAIDLPQVVAELGRREMNNVMLEAGSRLSGQMLQQGLVDELQIYLSPDVLGSAARGMFKIPGLESMADKFRFAFHDVRKVGRDMRLTMRPVMSRL